MCHRQIDFKKKNDPLSFALKIIILQIPPQSSTQQHINHDFRSLHSFIVIFSGIFHGIATLLIFQP